MPPNEDLVGLSDCYPTSGKGVDNRRTNAIEAFLNLLHQRRRQNKTRDLLLNSWRLVCFAGSCVAPGGNGVVKDWAENVIMCSNSVLPTLEMSDHEMLRYETVIHLLGPEELGRLSLIPPRTYASLKTIAECLSLIHI